MKTDQAGMLHHRVAAEKAEYRDHGLPEYNTNPLTAALPHILDPRQVESMIHYYPEYTGAERKMESTLRYHMIHRLKQYFQPWDKHYTVERHISIAIRQGYLSRNPLQPSYASNLQEIHKMVRNRSSDFSEINLSPAPAAGFSIIGFSGAGKTRAVEKILSLYPQVIVHEEFKGQPLNQYQIVWMKLNSPHDGSIKGLCSSFFMEFDRLLGSNAYSKFAAGRHTTTDLMIPQMAMLAGRHSLGMLVIDEIQHLSTAKSGGQEKMLNFFVELENRIGIPLVLIGTNKALPILQGEFRQARRSCGQHGSVLWDRITRTDPWWDILLEGLWSYQWTREKTPLTKELSDLIYDRSQGIVDVAVKLFMMSQVKAIASRKEKLTEGVIKSAAKEGLSLLDPMINALRTGDRRMIERYEDLLPLNVDDYYQKQINMDGSVRIIAENQLKNEPAESSGPLKTISKKNFPAEKDKNIIADIVNKGKENSKSAYEALKESGHIKDPVKELLLAG